MRRSIVLIALLAGALAGCDVVRQPAPQPAPVNPGPSTLDVVGIVNEHTQVGRTMTLVLVDGREVVVDPSTARQIHPGGGLPELLVTARDASGPWFALAGTQGGLPDDCFVLNEEGVDWGATIEIGGVSWRKDPAFDPALAVPIGTRYAGGTRFCLDEDAEVTTIIPR